MTGGTHAQCREATPHVCCMTNLSYLNAMIATCSNILRISMFTQYCLQRPIRFMQIFFAQKHLKNGINTTDKISHHNIYWRFPLTLTYQCVTLTTYKKQTACQSVLGSSCHKANCHNTRSCMLCGMLCVDNSNRISTTALTTQ